MAKILIAEDERAINDLIKLNLSLVGHKCEQVFDGTLALESALSGQYDLVILDVMLPGLSGFEIIGRIKTPVIFVTARVSVEDRLRGLKLGADDYIVKPFEIIELVERVKAGTLPPIDVYDAAVWMAIGPLSEASIAQNGAPRGLPRFHARQVAGSRARRRKQIRAARRDRGSHDADLRKEIRKKDEKFSSFFQFPHKRVRFHQERCGRMISQ